MSERDKSLELKQLMDTGNEMSEKSNEKLKRILDRMKKEEDADQEEITRLSALLTKLRARIEFRIDLAKKFGDKYGL